MLTRIVAYQIPIVYTISNEPISNPFYRTSSGILETTKTILGKPNKIFVIILCYVKPY